MVACSRNWWKSLWFFLNRKLFIDNDGNGDDDNDDADKGEFVADLDIDVVDVIEELNFVLFVVVHVDDEVVLVMVLFIGFTFVTGIDVVDVVDDSLRFLCFDDDNEVPDSRCVDSRKESLCFCIYFDECCWLLVVSAIWIDDGTFNEVANILLII